MYGVAFAQKMDFDQVILEAEKDESVPQDSSRGETIGIFVWDDQGLLVRFCAVRLLDHRDELLHLRKYVPFKNYLPCFFHLIFGSWPLNGSIFFFNRWGRVILRNHGLGLFGR